MPLQKSIASHFKLNPKLKLNNKPLVSILMTCYNREKYIAESIKSVLSSTYTSFEFIIVDDASTDATVAIIKDYLDNDNRIKLYINSKNVGDYPNRNLAASYANGKYLKYVDSDDCIYANCLDVMVDTMEKYPGAGFALCDVSGDIQRPLPFKLDPSEAYRYHFFGPGLFHKGPLQAIFLREAFEVVGGFNKGRMISDIDMWYRMGLQYPVVAMGEGLVWQRRHLEQELTERSGYILEGEKIKWNYLLDTRCGLNKQEVKYIQKNRLKRYLGFMISGLKRFNMQQINNYWKCYRYVAAIKVDKT